MAKRKKINIQTMIYKAPCSKLKIEQLECELGCFVCLGSSCSTSVILSKNPLKSHEGEKKERFSLMPLGN
jgi:hypothetical protein